MERPGMMVGGDLHDLSPVCRDIDLFDDPGLIDRLRGVDCSRLARVDGPVRLGPPLARVSKFVAIGLNYRDHAEEAGLAIPPEPIVFMKAPSCIGGACDPIVLPEGSRRTDWEVELGIVIGSETRQVRAEDAARHVAGYLVVNDVSERDFQFERGGTWDKGKGCDTFGPIGPWLVTADEIADCQSLDLWLDVNGVAMQRGSTRDMVFSCAQIVSYVSRFMTLLPGDIIATGTPAGVAMGRAQDVYLKAGDVVSLGIAGLGTQRQVVTAHHPSV